MLKNIAGGLQWAAFLAASSIAAPIAIAHLFGMDGAETAQFVQRTMLVLGTASLLQILLGHRLPINEGPAGLWWGVFVVYAGMSGVLYESENETLQALQSGILYSGLLFILFAATGLVSRMRKWFTPAVTFVYLMLLVLQLSGTFLNGMLGIETAGEPLDGRTAAGSIAVVLFALFCMNRTEGWMQRYSILLSILFGWSLFFLLGEADRTGAPPDSLIAFPEPFVFGAPIWDSGMFVTALFITLLLIANMMASVRVMENLLRSQFSREQEPRMKAGAIVSGVNHLLAGTFSAIGSVPIAGAAGFVSATRTPEARPFLLGSFFIIIGSFFPALMGLLAALPPAVAYAVTFTIFTKMVEMAFSELSAEEDQQKARRTAAFGLMIGVGLLFVPAESMKGLPNVLSATLSNGLITGTVAAIAVEQWLSRRKKTESRR